MAAAWKEQHCVELFLPVAEDQQGTGRTLVEELKRRLTEQYGGVTAYARAPAEGLWAERGAISEDRIVVLEVMVDEPDLDGWAELKRELEARLGQKDILVRATSTRRLTP